MRIDVVGMGNVGSHLARAFKGKADVAAVSSRTLAGLRPDADLYLICVSDNAIDEVAARVRAKVGAKAVVAHTSGATRMDGSVVNAVLYPLQTFSKEVELNYADIPFYIEGADERAERVCAEAARLVSENVKHADSTTRAKLHVGSVFACNFTNHLWALADDFLSANGLAFSDMLPLLRETLRKASTAAPAEVQTGPAARGDSKTIARHLALIGGDPQLQKLYITLTNSIIEKQNARKSESI